MLERFQAAGGSIQQNEMPPSLTPDLLAAARLNKRQERVYRECVEKDTPIDVVARWIGILEGKTVDVSQVSRIKRQAIRRVKAAKAALVKSVK